MMSIGQVGFFGCIVFAVIARFFVRSSGRGGSGLTPEAMRILVPFWTVGLISLGLILVGFLIRRANE